MCEHDGLSWRDIAIIGSLAGELYQDERRRQRLLKELEPEDVPEDAAGEEGKTLSLLV
jgi:hypothetical protein